MQLEIVSPERTLLTAEVDSVIVPGTDGSFQMLNNHAPIVSTLISGVVKISGDFENSETLPDSFSVVNSKELHLSVSSGVIEMKENKVIILTD
jgi:F-type H+-transporting ATPase subunit epsilon